MAEFHINTEDLKGLKGQVIIVTGGSSGIGFETVSLLLSLDAYVVNADVLPIPTVNVPTTSEGSYNYIETNVADWNSLVSLFNQAKQKFGRIDHVFANAGLSPRGDFINLATDQNGDPIRPNQATFDVNLHGAVDTGTLAVHYLKDQDTPSSILVNASFFAYQRGRIVDYITSKHAALGFSRSLYTALEVAGLGNKIRVNTVCPGWTATSIMPDLETKAKSAGIDYAFQSPSFVAKAAAHMFADKTRNGYSIVVHNGKFKEVDVAVYLSLANSFRGSDDMNEDKVIEIMMKYYKS